MWGGCKIRMATWGENGHARWLLHGTGDNSTHNTRWMQDENGHVRWEWSCEVTFVWWRGQLYTQHKVDMRWERPCEVRFAKSPCIQTWQRCHLTSMQNSKVVSCGQEVTLGWYCLCNVQSTNDETTLPPHVHAKWQSWLTWAWGDIE